MDVTLHYRPHQSNLPHLMKITQHLLTEFPTRPLPTFKPWFSCNGTFLKPAKAPPLISSKEADHISQLYITQEPVSVPGNNDWIMNLPEFCPMVKWKQKQEILRALSADYAHSVDEDSKSTKGLLRRAWSVSAPRGGLVKTNGTLSKELSSTLERLNLHCLHRAKWIIDDFNCNGKSLEEIWSVLSRAVRHNELPTCNAKIQPEVSQIWVFCDVLCSEYVGRLLKEMLNLNGQINLTVHRHGVICRM